MHALALIAALLIAPPESAQPAPESEFGELEADPEAETEDADSPEEDETVPDTDSASSGYGTLTPLPNYVEGGVEGEADPSGPPEVVTIGPPPEKKKKEQGFVEPTDFGPFYEPEPVSELEFPGEAQRLDEHKPFASVAGGAFCFVEDSACKASLIVDADVGVGVNVISSDRGFDVPYTQMRVRGGLVIRPVVLAKKRWHAWGVGLVGSYSFASPSIAATSRDPSDPFAGILETDPIRSGRVALINQLWLSQKRNAVHLDFTLGGVNSSVLDAQGRYWGTHAEFAVGFGGWGGLYLAGDFLDQDSRLFVGMRGHGIFTGPMVALLLLGLVAGGVAL